MNKPENLLHANINGELITGLILKLIRFPRPIICKHAVALDLLDACGRAGHAIPVELVKAIIDSDDERAEKILIEILENK